MEVGEHGCSLGAVTASRPVLGSGLRAPGSGLRTPGAGLRPLLWGWQQLWLGKNADATWRPERGR